MEELFDAPGVPWTRVSPRLRVVRRAELAVAAGVVVPACLLGLLLLEAPLWAWGVGVLALCGVFAWAWWLIGRTAARWGYAETAEELYITRGAMFRRVVVVPYGRMQFVDVQSGPVEQLNGIAQLRLHTASPGTSAVVPGLPAEEAARLRDRLTSLGESRSAGL